MEGRDNEPADHGREPNGPKPAGHLDRVSTPDAASPPDDTGFPPSLKGVSWDRELSSGKLLRVAEKVETETLLFLDPPQQEGELGWLAHFRVVKRLGSGGMGVVFLAEDSRLRRQVALKVMRPELAQDLTARQRFLREARAIAAIQSDHIVAIHDVGLVKNMPYLATELLHGKSLDAYLREDPRLTPAQVLDLGQQLARGLEAAHRTGLIHRDIKPANIWVEQPAHRIKILDFGLVRADGAAEGLTQAGELLGTPDYMAPEQADGQVVDPRADLFSLGCVLYEAASGEKPFRGTTPVAIVKATALSQPVPLHELAPTLPRALSDLVMRLLAKSPADRPASAAAVLEALEVIADNALTDSAVRASRPGRRVAPADGEEARRDLRRTRRVVLAVLLVVAGCSAPLLFWLLNRGNTHSAAAEDSVPGGATKAERASGSAAQGVSDDEVVVGLSAPFSGPARELGREMEIGIQTCFQAVNAEGGVAGRRLRLVALDDGYEPDRALANITELHDSRRVFAVLGNVGTSTAEKALPYALSKQMIFFGAFTGAGLLRRDPPDRYVFNYRASYAEETVAAVKYLIQVRGVRPEQIAVFAQQDAYGDAGFNGVARALRPWRKAEAIVRVDHLRNSVEVGDAVREVLRHDEIRAVVMVSTYRPVAAFIGRLKDAKRDLIFTSVSFVGTDALAEELRQRGKGYADGVIVTQVVPHPASYASAVLKYRELLHQFHPNEQAGFVSLEGYLAALVFVEGLRRAGANLTTEALVDALESIRDFDIGLGAPLRYGPSEHQALHKAWGAVLDAAGEFQILEIE